MFDRKDYKAEIILHETKPMEDLSELETRVPLMKLARDPHGHLLSNDPKLPPRLAMDRFDDSDLMNSQGPKGGRVDDNLETPANDARMFERLDQPLLPTRLVETCQVFSMVTMPSATPGSLWLRDVRIDLMRPNETVVSWLTTEDGATRFRVGQTVRLILEVA